jgi:hypothetical protein
MKYLRVTMPDGSKWDVPAKIIAENRALEVADGAQFLGTTQAEVEYALDNYAVLVDWAENNMNWDNVRSAAVMVKSEAAMDFQDGWVNGNKELIEK